MDGGDGGDRVLSQTAFCCAYPQVHAVAISLVQSKEWQVIEVGWSSGKAVVQDTAVSDWNMLVVAELLLTMIGHFLALSVEFFCSRAEVLGQFTLEKLALIVS